MVGNMGGMEKGGMNETRTCADVSNDLYFITPYVETLYEIGNMGDRGRVE